MDRHVLFAGRAHKDGDYHMYVDYRHLVQKRLLRPPNEFDPMIEAPPGIRECLFSSGESNTTMN